MKHVFSFLFILVAVASIFGAVPASTDQVFEAKIDTSVTWIDTLKDATDSSAILSSWSPKETEWIYYIINKPITGYSSDSVKFKIYGYSYNSSGTLLSKQLIDTLVSDDSKAIRIPINTTMKGSTYTIKALSYTGNGGQAITSGWQLVKYRPVNYRH